MSLLPLQRKDPLLLPCTAVSPRGHSSRCRPHLGWTQAAGRALALGEIPGCVLTFEHRSFSALRLPSCLSRHLSNVLEPTFSRSSLSTSNSTVSLGGRKRSEGPVRCATGDQSEYLCAKEKWITDQRAVLCAPNSRVFSRP